jgi:DNA-binding CsgD family transcriptional regulator
VTRRRVRQAQNPASATARATKIAANLNLSEATIKSHIARILAKLSLRDRVQVAVFACEKGIVRPGRSA